MEPVIAQLPTELLGHLDDGKIAQLIQLLEEARKPHSAIAE